MECQTLLQLFLLIQITYMTFGSTKNPTCPCRTTSSINTSDPKEVVESKHIICIAETAAANKLLSHVNMHHLNLNLRMVKGDSTVTSNFVTNNTVQGNKLIGCNVLLKITDDDSLVVAEDGFCPGICQSIPYSEIPINWLLPPYNISRELTCSLTIGAIFSPHNHSTFRNLRDEIDYEQANEAISNNFELSIENIPNNHVVLLGLMLRSIARRRVEECRERGYWSRGSWFDEINMNDQHHLSLHNATWTDESYLHPRKSVFTRRPVYGLIIWVGSNARLSLVRAQMEVLRNQHDKEDMQRIFGWAAFEDTYPCREGTTLCKVKPHLSGMPPSYIDTKGAGWACAQRRQLRAMSHALLLYDPDFLLVVDDDTYVNVDLITYGTNLSKFILTVMKINPIVYGEKWGYFISNNGYFLGGAGYLMGRGVIDKLVSYTLSGRPGESDIYRNSKLMKNLEFFPEVVKASKTATECSHCVHINENNNEAKLSVRVVEICANMMSGENTCLHSDHALSRCLIHGVYATPLGVRSNGTQISSNPEIVLSMCQHPPDNKCILQRTLTCHRMMPADVKNPRKGAKILDLAYTNITSN